MTFTIQFDIRYIIYVCFCRDARQSDILIGTLHTNNHATWMPNLPVPQTAWRVLQCVPCRYRCRDPELLLLSDIPGNNRRKSMNEALKCHQWYIYPQAIGLTTILQQNLSLLVALLIGAWCQCLSWSKPEKAVNGPRIFFNHKLTQLRRDISTCVLASDTTNNSVYEMLTTSTINEPMAGQESSQQR